MSVHEECGVFGIFASHRDLGLVGEVFPDEELSRLLQGTMAVGHTRYGTTGATNRRNRQPIEVNHRKGLMSIAHSGNLSNAAGLRGALGLTGGKHYCYACFTSRYPTAILTGSRKDRFEQKLSERQ